MTLHIFSLVQFWRRVLGSSSGASWYLRTALATLGNIESYNKTSIRQSNNLSFRFITSIYTWTIFFQSLFAFNSCISFSVYDSSQVLLWACIARRINSLLDHATILLFLGISAYFSEYILPQKCAIVIIMNVV